MGGGGERDLSIIFFHLLMCSPVVFNVLYSNCKHGNYGLCVGVNYGV